MCYLHGIAYVAVEVGDYQMAGRENGRGRAETLDCETTYGIQQADSSDGDQDATEKTKAKDWLFQAPTGDPPGHDSGYEAGSDDRRCLAVHLPM